MEYSISDVAEMMGVTSHTLRYYDKEGILPDVKRVNGKRVFTEEDIKWLKIITCLKNTNMPIKKMKEFFELVRLGDKSLQQRYDMILEQKESILAQIKELEYYLKEVEYKEWYYTEALKDGTEKNVIKYSKNTWDIDEIPKRG